MVDSEFSVLLWSKAFVLDLDQAEQFNLVVPHNHKMISNKIKAGMGL